MTAPGRLRTSAFDGGLNGSTQHRDSQGRGRMLLMKRRTRIQYTEADKALMWERWRQAIRCMQSLVSSIVTILRLVGCSQGLAGYGHGLDVALRWPWF